MQVRYYRSRFHPVCPAVILCLFCCFLFVLCLAFLSWSFFWHSASKDSFPTRQGREHCHQLSRQAYIYFIFAWGKHLMLTSALSTAWLLIVLFCPASKRRIKINQHQFILGGVNKAVEVTPLSLSCSLSLVSLSLSLTLWCYQREEVER